MRVYHYMLVFVETDVPCDCTQYMSGDLLSSILFLMKIYEFWKSRLSLLNPVRFREKI